VSKKLAILMEDVGPDLDERTDNLQKHSSRPRKNAVLIRTSAEKSSPRRDRSQFGSRGRPSVRATRRAGAKPTRSALEVSHPPHTFITQ